MTANGYRFIGIAPEVDLTERRSKMINDQTEPFTVDDIRGYKVFTALLTQSGGSDNIPLQTGNLEIGTTYVIEDNSPRMDFTNVGAPNNEIGTYFIATGTTPNSWGLLEGETDILIYNTGAPVATVLENTIGNVWFSYMQIGIYAINSVIENSYFDENKTLSFIGTTNDNYSGLGIFEIYTNNPTQIQLLSFNASDMAIADGLLANTPIEIRVYN